MMAKHVKKSRTFATVLVLGNELGAYFLCQKTETDQETGEQTTFLDIQSHRTNLEPKHKDDLIQMLVKAGLTVRFYDPEEKQWMDLSTSYGLVRAPGARDGTWGPPTTAEEFNEEYLGTV